MEPEFWHGKWQRNEIGFHEGKPNRLLTRHLGRLGLRPASHILVPLCGKTADIPWLMAAGFRVSGVELNPLAVEQLFSGLGLDATIAQAGRLVRHSAPGIDLYLGDVFELSAEMLGGVDAVYDRAALVALPSDIRARYARHLAAITAAAPQLLVSFDYDTASMEGPPFSVEGAEIEALYGDTHTISLLERVKVEALRTARDVHESIWMLTPRD